MARPCIPPCYIKPWGKDSQGKRNYSSTANTGLLHFKQFWDEQTKLVASIPEDQYASVDFTVETGWDDVSKDKTFMRGQDMTELCIAARHIGIGQLHLFHRHNMVDPTCRDNHDETYIFAPGKRTQIKGLFDDYVCDLFDNGVEGLLDWVDCLRQYTCDFGVLVMDFNGRTGDIDKTMTKINSNLYPLMQKGERYIIGNAQYRNFCVEECKRQAEKRRLEGMGLSPDPVVKGGGGGGGEVSIGDRFASSMQGEIPSVAPPPVNVLDPRMSSVLLFDASRSASGGSTRGSHSNNYPQQVNPIIAYINHNTNGFAYNYNGVYNGSYMPNQHQPQPQGYPSLDPSLSRSHSHPSHVASLGPTGTYMTGTGTYLPQPPMIPTGTYLLQPPMIPMYQQYDPRVSTQIPQPYYYAAHQVPDLSQSPSRSRTRSHQIDEHSRRDSSRSPSPSRATRATGSSSPAPSLSRDDRIPQVPHLSEKEAWNRRLQTVEYLRRQEAEIRYPAHFNYAELQCKDYQDMNIDKNTDFGRDSDETRLSDTHKRIPPRPHTDPIISSHQDPRIACR